MAELLQERSIATPVEAAEALFLENLDAIRKISKHVAYRYRLNGPDRDDFEAEVNLKLINDDYKIMRQFEGRCKLDSYLFLIINRIYWEWRHKSEGRWRPSAQAVRLGDAAIKLETMIYRDGYLASEACRIMQYRDGLPEPECESLLQQLPCRQRREMVAGADFDALASPASNHEQTFLNREREVLGRSVQSALDHALTQLPSEDQLILKLHFHENLKQVDIARSLGYPVKKLYKRVKKLLTNLQKELRRAGFGKENQEELFEAIKIAAFLNGEETQSLSFKSREVLT